MGLAALAPEPPQSNSEDCIMATPNLGWENQVENTLQPGVAFNLLADDADAAIAGCVAVDFDADGNLTLDRGQWMTSVLALTDDDNVLTGAVEVIFPAAFPCMLVVNGTAQALTLTNGDTDEVPLPAGDSVRISAGPSGVLADPSGSGGGGAEAYTIITQGSAFTADPGTHDGLTRYIRAGGDVTFDNAEPYTSGMVFNIRATAGIDLVEDGVTLTPPAGGTLELSAGMAVQVVMTGATTADVIGQTVAAP